MVRIRSVAAALAAGLVWAAPACAFVRWYPVVGADFLLGQHFLDGDPSSWGGNLDLRVIPAVKFSEDLVFIPSLVVAYQGTKDVTEVAGGTQLFQDSLTTSLNLKPVKQFGSLRVKPYAGYRMDYLRETKDESLGKGLFDFTKTSAGLELEWVFNPRQWASVSADLYQIRFPNYSSLESQADSSLGRENAASSTLDSDSLGASAAWNTDTPFPETRASFDLTWAGKDFTDQRLVDESGQLRTSKRRDEALGYGGTLVWNRGAAGKWEAAVAAGASQTVVRSNQNHYDARLAVFVDDYYSYQETALQPSVELGVPKKGALRVTYLLADRLYFGRPIQDAGGSYLEDRVRIRSRTLSFRLSIPLGAGFKALAQSHLTDSSSNQRYEKVYRYDYSIASHLIGVSWEY